VFSFFLRKVFSKNIDHKLDPILTLCFHSYLNPYQEQSALPKKIPGSLPLKHGISYRGTYPVAQSKGPTVRIKALPLSKVNRKRGQKKLLPYREAKILGTRDHKHQGHRPHHSPVPPARVPASMRTTTAPRPPLQRTTATHAPFAAHPPPPSSPATGPPFPYHTCFHVAPAPSPPLRT
jgi:hypothetical protein